MNEEISSKKKVALFASALNSVLYKISVFCSW